MRWWVFFVVLLLVPSVSALSITSCPASVTAGQTFTVTVSQNGAEYVGVDNGAGITDQAHATSAVLSTHIDTPDPNQQIFPAFKNLGDTTWQYDTSVFCYIEVTPVDHPATVPIQASATTRVIGQQFWVESYDATDPDGINKLVLYRSKDGGSFSQVYPVKYCNGATSCSHLWWLTENSAGTYTYKVTLTDSNTNTYDSQTLTVTVSDPCVDNPPNCDDGNPCTTDTCVVQGGQATCAHDAVADYQVCGTNKACEAGVCKTTCVVLPNYLCADPMPAHSESHNADYYCTGSPQCFTCDSGFHPDGGQCVSDVTCQDECSPSGTVSCQDATHNKTCSDWDGDGCLEWGGIQACPAGTTCNNGACEETCTNECTDGDTRCDTE